MFEAVTGFSAASFGVAEPDLRRRVVEEVMRAFGAARLVAETDPWARPHLHWGCGRSGSDAARREGAGPGPLETEAPRRRPREPDPKRTWIEIEMLDDGGKPMAGERVALTLADGSTRVQALDARGRLRLEGIDPGTCEVTFPDRDGRDWRAV